MTNVILSRLELLADQQERIAVSTMEAHVIALTCEEARYAEVTNFEFFRMIAFLDFELDNMVYNMSLRCKARGFKKKLDRFRWLHGLYFDQTYVMLSDSSRRDFRVREYFDPLLRICGGDKKLLMNRYKLALDRYFPVTADGVTWGPVMRKIPFKPRRKSDARIETYTVVHNYHHI